MDDWFDSVKELGTRFTKYCYFSYLFWFVLGFFVTSPYLGWWWIPLVLFGSPLIGLYLVATPYYVALATIGEFIFWVVSLLTSEDRFLEMVSAAIRGVFYSVAVIMQFVLARLSIELINDWFV